MALADNRYSRFVQIAKVVSPLIALGFLSTLFLFSRSIDPDAAIPFADIDVKKIAREQILASPKFAGVTSDGASILVTASTAKPDQDNPKILKAEGVRTRIETETDGDYDILAEHALYDGDAQSLDLTGSVSVETSSGYRFTTDMLIAAIKSGDLTSPGPVSGETPSGQLDAGSMTLTREADSQLLVFKDGVKLVYNP